MTVAGQARRQARRGKTNQYGTIKSIGADEGQDCELLK